MPDERPATRRGMRLPVLLWFATLAAVGTLMHVDLVDSRYYPDQQELHAAIVSHAAPAPYQYRVLQPALVELSLKASGAAAGTVPYRRVFMAAYAGIRFLAIFATLLGVFLALRSTWPDETAVLAATALAAFLPFTYRYYYYQPTSVVEMAFFAAGLLAARTRAAWALLPLVAVGSLNRETMCFVPFAYFLYWLPALRRAEWVWLGASAAAWVAVFAGLRLLWPAPHDLLDVSRALSLNLQLARGNLDLLVILAPSLLLLVRARQLPASSARLALCSVPWVLLHFLTARWYEIRYYMPVLIWLLPGLIFVFSGDGPADKSREQV